MWENILKKEQKNPCVTNLTIHEVDSSKLEELGLSGGATIPQVDKDNNLASVIFIDKTLDENLKITVLYHELGHAIYNKDNEEETKKYLNHELSKPNKEERQEKSELKAFKHSLIYLHKLAKEGNTEPLEDTIKRLESRENDDCNLNYRKAITKLKKTEIWEDCLKIIKK